MEALSFRRLLLLLGPAPSADAAVADAALGGSTELLVPAAGFAVEPPAGCDSWKERKRELVSDSQDLARSATGHHHTR